MQTFSTSPLEMLACIWRNRSLIETLTRREVMGRYRGSVAGILWSFFHPLLMLAVFTFVFGTVFKARWGIGSDSRVEFALVLFSGMLVFNFFSECVNRAPGLVLSNVNYVKKVVFPLEILVLVSVGASLFHLLVGLAMWSIFFLVFLGIPGATALLVPLVLLPVILLATGLSWLLASLGVYLRDVAHVVGVGTTALMFLSPLFYPLSAFPESYRGWIMANPVSLGIENMRDILIWKRLPEVVGFSIYLLVSAIVLWLGFIWFQKTRRGFADVL